MKKITFQILFGLFFIGLLSSLSLARSQTFVHPGALHTRSDLDRMKGKVLERTHPWIDGWNLLITDRKAQSNWIAAPAPNMPSRQRAQDDATAMYYNALRWYISGDVSYADCAVRIANGWSSKVNQRPAGDYLSAIPVGSFAIAAELLRLYSGWSDTDQSNFKRMLLDHWYPKCDEFLRTHGGSPDSHYWANWDTCNMLAVLAIGVFCDDRAKYDQAVEYFKNGRGMGSIKNAVPFLYPNGLGQWQESGRDQAHAMGGMGQLAEFCQVAWNQGLDLFGYDDNRLLKGAEYTAQYTLWKGVPYTFYNTADNARQSYISANYHGRLQASHFELLYNHYVVRQGLKAPHLKLFAELKRPEDGNVDIFGYGTLTFTLDGKASPYPASTAPLTPMNVSARAGLGQVELMWTPSGAYNVRGYEVWRATNKNGPYESISSTQEWTTPKYTDTKVENGKTYCYKVVALNQYGQSERSESVSASPATGGDLPAQWTNGTTAGITARTLFAEIANGSFVLPAAGTGLGGAADEANFTYRKVTGDFTLTARLIGRTGSVNMTGLMCREDSTNNAKAVILSLGEVGGRQTKMRTRAKPNENTEVQSGNDYTWIPVWYRLQRQGDIFVASQSSDGIEWFEVGKSAVIMPPTCLLGIAASTGSVTSTSSEVRFDNVSIRPKPPLAPKPPTGLSVTPIDDSIKLIWKNNAVEPAGIKIEASTKGEPFYEIADLSAGASVFIDTGRHDFQALQYRIRAYSTGGYSPYSSIVRLKP
jgi:regulation of enolase protein 1 (concanavalin A-like superfamily)